MKLCFLPRMVGTVSGRFRLSPQVAPVSSIFSVRSSDKGIFRAVADAEDMYVVGMGRRNESEDPCEHFKRTMFLLHFRG